MDTRTLLAGLDRLGLLSPERLAEAERLAAAHPDPPACYAALARRGWLTPLQARWLARGRLPLVGPYVLVHRLGGGGMARVHLARHRLLRRAVALKTLRAADAHARRRFARECEALGRLDHPHVAHAFDAGVKGAVLWLALEHLAGPDLARLAAAGPLPPAAACEYARQAALGLAHVHERGVVHRDVKPANLMLDRFGRVKVLDVGLARPVWAAGGLTKAGVMLGTPDYAAPEQVLDARRVGPAADQYALGCTLYVLLAGRVPFSAGTPVAQALARLTADPPAVEAVRPGVPAGVGAVVRRLLARRPADRYPSMAAAAAALAAFATPVPVPPPLAAGDTAAELPAVGDAPTRAGDPDQAARPGLTADTVEYPRPG